MRSAPGAARVTSSPTSPMLRAVGAGVKQAVAARGPIDHSDRECRRRGERAVCEGPVADSSSDMFDLNVMGVVHCRAGGDRRHGRSAGPAASSPMASTAGLKGYAYVSAYCAAKHAVVGLVRSLAQETAKPGVHRECRVPRLHRHRSGAREPRPDHEPRPAARARTRMARHAEGQAARRA